MGNMITTRRAEEEIRSDLKIAEHAMVAELGATGWSSAKCVNVLTHGGTHLSTLDKATQLHIINKFSHMQVGALMSYVTVTDEQSQSTRIPFQSGWKICHRAVISQTLDPEFTTKF